MLPYDSSHGLMIEQLPLSHLAEKEGTPLYVYSRRFILEQWQAFDKAFAAIPHTICYAVKANSNLAILNLLAQQGSGFDIVSQGELERVLKAKGDPKKVVFSGIGKTVSAIRRALEVGIGAFNVESLPELERINTVAEELHCQAPIMLRVNPDVDAKTHPYISTGLKENKFGIPAQDIKQAYQLAQKLPHLRIEGVACHIGSQLLELAPFEEALEKMLDLIESLKKMGITLKTLDLGGGLGVTYRDEISPSIPDYARLLLQKLSGSSLKLILEPGRAIVANAGILLARVEYLKTTPDKKFAILDAGMNDLLRPALYDAWHTILPVTPLNPEVTPELYDIVGPVCETADFLGKDRRLALKPNDLLAILSAGAYGFSMSSQYNSRPRAAEILVDGEHYQVIRQRETWEDLFRHENFA